VRHLLSLRRAIVASAALALPTLAHAQQAPKTPPRDTSAHAADSSAHGGTVVDIGGLPVQLDLRMEAKERQDLNQRCNSLQALNTLSGCRAPFIGPEFQYRFALKSVGTLGDQLHVNVDYDDQREFQASNALSLWVEGKPGSHLERLDLGNISFAPPSSRYITSSLPSGNYGIQAIGRFGRMQLKTIFAKQTGNVVQRQQFTIGARTAEPNARDVDDYQIERDRFFFTVDPIRFGSAFPNIDILNRGQLNRLRAALPAEYRPTRVFVYRLQFGTQPQNPNGPRFRLQGDSTGSQVYDLLREGVDYYMDPSLLWFALVRPLNENNERLVVAYNVNVNGRDTVIASTGGTPDIAFTTAHEQVANLVMDPNVGPSSPAFRNEIRSVYRISGPGLIRQTMQVRVVTGSGLLEHPLAGTDATFLQMLGLAQPTNAAEFDYENRIWPRVSDATFNLGAGAVDVRNGQSTDLAQIISDYFLVFPSLHPFSARDSGLVVPGNPTNDAIYTIPGEYLYSPQHPPPAYRLHLEYEVAGTDVAGAITLGASQMRQGSERVLVDGRPLVRDLDYRIDYDLGRIEFMRPDTLFRLERHVEVSYEDNPTFISTPTSLAGFVSELPVSHGLLSFTAIDQTQASTFTRPQLGFQGASSLMAGFTGAFNWDAPALTRFASALPFGNTKVPSRFSINAEMASSHPQFGLGSQGQAYVETFDAESGTPIPLADISWYYSSLPAYGNTLHRIGTFEPTNAATLVWQTFVRDARGNLIQFKQTDIDPLTHLAGTGVLFNEPVLWLSLLPLADGGQFNRSTKKYDWTVANTPPGRRFRSIRTVLSPAGLDLTNHELLQFWTLVDTSITGRGKNPTLVFDFGDVSENSLTFAPETLTIVHNANGAVDSLFTGKKKQGFDSLDTERDPFTRAFNVEVNDTGLPGDVADTLVVIDGTSVKRVLRAPLCHGALGVADFLGDPHTNCTVGNNRLDEEDIDQDNALNFTNAERERERLLRYVVDLSNPGLYKRVGKTFSDTVVVNGIPEARKREWVLVSIPFKTPTDSLNDVNRRRIRALRLTVVSGAQEPDNETTQFPIAELEITGAPWIDRSNVTLAGIAGVQPEGGFVIASTIGTNDSSTAVVYQPPPGVTDETVNKGGQLSPGLTAINERSMRIQAGNMPLNNRAETYFRFPAGPQNYFAFRQLHVWGRGRGDGWGENGDLQMYVKLGRDENNFYLYRTSLSAGQTPAAWTDVAVDFNKFIDLRKQVQADYLAGKSQSIRCTGADSALIAASPIPAGLVAHRFAACEDGYMVYTIDPAVAAPNLQSVQEIAVGIVRVAAGGTTPILPSDTLELWVDDIRLTQPVSTGGMAGQVAMNMNIADFADMRVNVGNRDPNFRQLGEQPTFQSQRNIDIASTIRLEKLLPAGAGIAVPLTIQKTSLASDPLFLSQSDISGRGLPGIRAPKNDLTTYTLSVRRSTPLDVRMLGPLVNNLSATTTYVSGVDRTEFQDGNSHNLTVALDYLVTDDSARTARLPAWVDGALGALPAVLQDGPLGTLRHTVFRWNPTQIRFTSGIVRADDHRVSYLKPSDAVSDAPAASEALSRLWRNGGVLELRPTTSLDARWELQSTRDMRNYGDSLAAAQGFSQSAIGVGQGFERERAMLTNFSFAPAFSAWFHPRTDLGAQYSMLRDPNQRRLSELPGVIGIDSVLAQHDSLVTARGLALPRRMTAAQTSSIGTMIDVARAFATYTRDSGVVRRIGKFFAPIDVSYTRSLLSAIDESPVDAPLSLQLGLGGTSAFRRIDGVNATTAGRTGSLDASGALLLPLGTSFVSRYRHVTTDNWILRPDSSQAQAAGAQTTFPDVALHWAYRPAAVTTVVSSVDASAGYSHSTVGVSLPSFADDLPPEFRRTNQETFPIGASFSWAVRGSPSTALNFQHTNRIDSLPGSVARSHTNELSADAGRAFHIPESWGLGLKSDVRTRVGYQQSRTITDIFADDAAIERRLQDNGRQSFTLAGDTNVQDNLVLTFQGSHVVTFDNTLNRRFAQTVFSIVFQLQMYGSVK